MLDSAGRSRIDPPVKEGKGSQVAHPQAIEATPLRVGGHRDAVAVKLACGIIAFSQTQALALAVPAAV